ncbi:MAG: class I SAM-dependent methyltransferase [Anaerolineales bacterium]|jgi:SAM-dependent methyltransferase
MNHQDHLALLRDGIPTKGGVWADFGSGRGAFTSALAELLGSDGQIYSIDKDRRALIAQARLLGGQLSSKELPKIHYIRKDYSNPIDLPLLDGLVMANTLHFQRQKEPILAQIINYLKPGGRLILVEYNVDHGNVWVPYPISYPTWESLATKMGFIETRLLEHRPSHFLNEIYSVLNIKPWS